MSTDMAERAVFTPGPWQQDGSHIYGPDPLRRIILQVSYAGRGYQREDAANERLLLAAPDLYEALKNAHRYIFTEDGPDEIDRGVLATEIEAALAKSEGNDD
jgi:hypothetical protein